MSHSDQEIVDTQEIAVTYVNTNVDMNKDRNKRGDSECMTLALKDLLELVRYLQSASLSRLVLASESCDLLISTARQNLAAPINGIETRINMVVKKKIRNGDKTQNFIYETAWFRSQTPISTESRKSHLTDSR